MDIKSNLAVDENKENRKMAATKTFSEIASLETDTCKTSRCCEISNEAQDQNHGTSVSKPASAEVTRLTSEVDHSNEIENTSIEQIPDVPVLVRSAEEKQIDMNSSCGPFGEPVGEYFNVLHFFIKVSHAYSFIIFLLVFVDHF